MKTLIIHPKDRSTDFLKPIYAGILDQTVITGGTTRNELHELIRSHDRIIMMGHGYPGGLFSVGQFPSPEAIIGYNELEHLQGKENIFIWCNAHSFIEKHDLHGFYTGMFISEVGEAEWCGLPGTKQSEVDESNSYFANTLGNIILEETDLKNIHLNIKQKYGLLVENGNNVASYNHYRLYHR